jgi:integrase
MAVVRRLRHDEPLRRASLLGSRKVAHYDYTPLIRLLVLTGLRISEERTLTEPKTKTGRRDVPIAPGLVDMLVTLKPEDAREDNFVFSTTGLTPIAHWNFRDRGFVPALKKAGLADKEITIHGLRSAAISLYATRGLSMLETATMMGQSDPRVTWKHYARLFDRSDVEARVRAAQASIESTDSCSKPKTAADSNV